MLTMVADFRVPIEIYPQFEALLKQHEPTSDCIKINKYNMRVFRCKFRNMYKLNSFKNDFNVLLKSKSNA